MKMINYSNEQNESPIRPKPTAAQVYEANKSDLATMVNQYLANVIYIKDPDDRVFQKHAIDYLHDRVATIIEQKKEDPLFHPFTFIGQKTTVLVPTDNNQMQEGVAVQQRFSNSLSKATSYTVTKQVEA